MRESTSLAWTFLHANLQEQLIRIAGLGKVLQKMDPHLYPSGFKGVSACWGPATVSVAEKLVLPAWMVTQKQQHTKSQRGKKTQNNMAHGNCWYQKCPGFSSCQCLLEVCQNRTFFPKRGSVLLFQKLQCTELDIFRATSSACPLPTSSSYVLKSFPGKVSNLPGIILRGLS